MDKIKIYKIGSDKAEQLQIIAKKTFTETFAKNNSDENMQLYLNNSFTVEKLTDELTTENCEFYFAELDCKIIGYLKINFGQAQTELQDKEAFEIERIYVLNEFHGKKIGQALYEKALEIGKKSSADYVWLGVWGGNLRAINFYKKNGFTPFDKHVFKLGNDVQTDIMMRLKIRHD